MRMSVLAFAAAGTMAALAASCAEAPPPPNSSPVPALSAYDGTYPHDTQIQPQFLDHPLVRGAVEQVVGDAAVRQRVLDPAGPKTPIWIAGDRIHSWGCEQHRCGPHNWTISMKLDGSEPEVCYHRADTSESGATWYLAGHTEIRDFHCPSEQADG